MKRDAKSCTLDQLMIELARLRALHGNIPVVLDDPDTSYRMPIGVVFKDENKVEQWPARIEIKAQYSGPVPGTEFYAGK